MNSILRKFVPSAALILGMLLQISPIPLRAWDLQSAGLTPASIPAGAVPVTSSSKADFDGNGTFEKLSLANSRAEISSDGQVVWQSPEAWQVVQAEITDLNRDGAPEATLLVWRPFRSWPADQWLPHGGRIADFHDAKGNSCHIILIGWQDGRYRERWAGSALAEPVKAFTAADLNGDHAQELVTLEGKYAGSRSAPAQELKVWEWNGFGFTVVSTIGGAFDKLALVQASDGRILILVP